MEVLTDTFKTAVALWRNYTYLWVQTLLCFKNKNKKKKPTQVICSQAIEIYMLIRLGPTNRFGVNVLAAPLCIKLLYWKVKCAGSNNTASQM